MVDWSSFELTSNYTENSSFFSASFRDLSENLLTEIPEGVLDNTTSLEIL